mgnify:FL=1
MVRVEFVDRDGVSGTVDARLSVEYDGRYDRIEGRVNALRDEYPLADNRDAPRDAFEQLLIELPQRLPVRAARICDADRRDRGEPAVERPGCRQFSE